ncbi:MAG: CRISPR-associated helicase Cas3' [Candidatus Marinimicrobia bacterium]|nr:CRISPR-associated helicase Cas3' [Candidatus Neomarinimicrobiota bacterium]
MQKLISYLISHPKDDNKEEKLLFDHLSNVARDCKQKVLSDALNLKLITREKLTDLVYDIGLLHDFGKSTIYFQKYIRDTQSSLVPEKYKQHSFISALISFFTIRAKYQNDLWAYLAFHIIFRHHGDLIDFDLAQDEKLYSKNIVRQQLDNICCKDQVVDFYKDNDLDIDIIEDIDFEEFEEFLEDTDFFISKNIDKEDEQIEFFLIASYLFSLLIEKDKADASRINEDSYFKGSAGEILCDVPDYINYLKKQNPIKFDPGNKVNRVRSEFFRNVIENEKIHPDNHIYTLTAPTGIGKTLTCLAFATALKNKINRNNTNIIYCLPFTSIIDQNYDVFEDVLKYKLKNKYEKRPTRYLLKHHHLSSKEVVNRTLHENQKYTDYLEDKLFVESWQSALIVTTFVQLFHSIFSNKNKNLKKFHNIVNSIIILDEVQNVDPDYYFLVNRIFKILAGRFNTYFLLMTATQPFIFNTKDSVELNPNETINEVFNRTEISVSLNKIDSEKFIGIFSQKYRVKNALVVMNTKSKAVELYEKLKEIYSDHTVYCLTNYLIPKDKKEMIKKVREQLNLNKKIILVSTQLIEAGVDLSFHDVFRDFAPLDSIIQVAGRCNRNSEFGVLGGKMYLVNFDNHSIYDKKSILTTERLLIDKQKITSNDFYNLSRGYYQCFEPGRKSKNLLSAIRELNFDTPRNDQIPVSDFTLIPQTAQINIHIFPDLNDQKIINKLFDTKQKLLTKTYHSDKEKDDLRIRLEQIKVELKQFQISLYENDLKSYKGLIKPEEEYKKNKYYPYLFIEHQNLKYDSNIGFRPKNIEEEIEDNFI